MHVEGRTCLRAPNKPLYQTRVTYRVSWKSVQPFSSDAGPNRQTDRHTDRQTQTHRQTETDRNTDRQTKNNFKNVIFVFSALTYTYWYDLFLKKSKITRNFWLTDLYIYKDMTHNPNTCISSCYSIRSHICISTQMNSQVSVCLSCVCLSVWAGITGERLNRFPWNSVCNTGLFWLRL